MIKYIIPFRYLFTSRLQPRQDRVSWFLVQPLAQLVLVYISMPSGPWLGRVVLAALAISVWQTLYEIGYLENDARTVKRETRPTDRLDPVARQYIDDNFAIIVVIRILVVVFLGTVLVLLAKSLGVTLNGGLFALLMLISMVAFHLHNRIRNRWNIGTYAALTVIRYCAVPLLLAPAEVFLEVLLVSLLMMPVLRTAEHATKPKYGFSSLHRLMTPFSRLRPFYYAVLLIASGGLFLIGLSRPIGLVVFAYYFLFRISIFLLIRRGAVKATKHQAYEKE